MDWSSSVNCALVRGDAESSAVVTVMQIKCLGQKAPKMHNAHGKYTIVASIAAYFDARRVEEESICTGNHLTEKKPKNLCEEVTCNTTRRESIKKI